MDKLINIVGILCSYVNRCAKCDTGRKKNCPWIAAFATPAATAIQEGATHEDRAFAAHENAGSPCHPSSAVLEETWPAAENATVATRKRTIIKRFIAFKHYL